ncbi:phosphatase PAP2 family protein [Schaalia hyovaginalis]|uniref:phosphatase PAP2 family protein n=1 Tax=Schaalia hyovaginalis TaxID=29316 RepID=UPI002A81D673|nr:phosphatase PAP2 family protein [Schaalia hyovaginalis]MDY3665784.1 phosphatase PAP2 family protein [Schaalia hyovaginalis]
MSRPHPGDGERARTPSDLPPHLALRPFEVSLGPIRIASGLVLLLVALALGLLVTLKPIAELDQRVLEWFVARRSPGATAVMEALTALFAPTTAVIGALVIGALVGAASRSALLGVYIPASMALASAFTAVAKDGIERVRPALPERIVVELSHSYPSGHTTAAAALAVSAAILLISRFAWTRPPVRGVVVGASRARASAEAGGDSARRAVHEDFVRWSRPVRRALIILAAVGLVVLIATTRVYLGAHWLSDVVGGAMVGAGASLVLAGILQPRSS